jgi:dnd system-associated protein 4
MMATGDKRVEREDSKDGLLKQLTDDGPFSTYRDVLVFAAALGFKKGVRKPLAKKKGEPIRWDVMSNRHGTETLVNMMSAITYPTDPGILEDDRFAERIVIFEEFANGGLEVLQGEISKSLKSPTDVVLQLTRENLSSDNPPGAPDISELLVDFAKE